MSIPNKNMVEFLLIIVSILAACLAVNVLVVLDHSEALRGQQEAFKELSKWMEMQEEINKAIGEELKGV